MRASASAFAFAFAFAFAALSALSIAAAFPLWGQDGHAVVAVVAESFLTSDATAKATSILDGQTLEDVASWADQIRKESEWSWSAPLHYINTADWECGFKPDQDCADSMCVYGAILNYTDRLVTQSDPTQVQEALKFVVHFYGDIHQPLHVGFTTDEGGNKIDGTFEGESTELHAVWDVPMVDLSITRDYGSVDGYANFLVQQLNGVWNGNSTVTGACSDSTTTVCPEEWAIESAELACSNAYVDQNGNVIKDGFNLGDPYYDHNKPVVDMQLARAGYRLARTLNALLAPSSVVSKK